MRQLGVCVIICLLDLWFMRITWSYDFFLLLRMHTYLSVVLAPRKCQVKARSANNGGRWICANFGEIMHYLDIVRLSSNTKWVSCIMCNNGTCSMSLCASTWLNFHGCTIFIDYIYQIETCSVFLANDCIPSGMTTHVSESTQKFPSLSFLCIYLPYQMCVDWLKHSSTYTSR